MIRISRAYRAISAVLLFAAFLFSAQRSAWGCVAEYCLPQQIALADTIVIGKIGKSPGGLAITIERTLKGDTGRNDLLLVTREDAGPPSTTPLGEVVLATLVRFAKEGEPRDDYILLGTWSNNSYPHYPGKSGMTASIVQLENIVLEVMSILAEPLLEIRLGKLIQMLESNEPPRQLAAIECAAWVESLFKSDNSLNRHTAGRCFFALAMQLWGDASIEGASAIWNMLTYAPPSIALTILFERLDSQDERMRKTAGSKLYTYSDLLLDRPGITPPAGDDRTAFIKQLETAWEVRGPSIRKKDADSLLPWLESENALIRRAADLYLQLITGQNAGFGWQSSGEDSKKAERLKWVMLIDSWRSENKEEKGVNSQLDWPLKKEDSSSQDTGYGLLLILLAASAVIAVALIAGLMLVKRRSRVQI